MKDEKLGSGTAKPQTRPEHPEVHKLREFLKVTKKIYKLAACLTDEEAEVGLSGRQANLQHLNQLFQHLGIDPDSESAWRQLGEMEQAFTDREIKPQPVIDVPGPGFFTSRVQEIVRGPKSLYAPTVRAVGNISLQEVIMYGHTDWAAVGPRGKDSIGEYLHDVARVMADPISYHLNFARADMGRDYSNDHAAVREDWRIANGRHRSLVARALGVEYVAEAGMDQWMHVTVRE